MTLNEAAQLLEVPIDASVEQLESRFLELRRKLEDKIAKAPTPGLQAKYRASLEQITEAFENLTLAADGDMLPVLERSVPAQEPAAQPAPTPAGPPPSAAATKPRADHASKSNREFIVVALIAVLLLGAGAWWVVSTRAESAERARVEAEAIAQAQLEEARRIAEAAEAEARREQLLIDSRVKLAEAKIRWDNTQQELLSAEKAQAELRDSIRAIEGRLQEPLSRLSDLRQTILAVQSKPFGAGSAETRARQAHAKVLEDYRALMQQSGVGALVKKQWQLRNHTQFAQWLRDNLQAHPARIARAKAEEFLSARQAEAAATAMAELETALDELVVEIAPRRADLLKIETGTLAVDSSPAGLNWNAVDAFGQAFSGVTPAKIEGVAPGTVLVTVSRQGFSDVGQLVDVSAGRAAQVSAALVTEPVRVNTGDPAVGIWFNNLLYGVGEATLWIDAPGEYTLYLAKSGNPTGTVRMDVWQGDADSEQRVMRVDYASMEQRSHRCPKCSGKGQTSSFRRCDNCDGNGRYECNYCHGSGRTNSSFYGNISCPRCHGDRKLTCASCRGQRGETTYYNCYTCDQFGRISELTRQNL
ncbi:MAG: hypothetical protein ACNA77_07190 [Opitutales bacterium]